MKDNMYQGNIKNNYHLGKIGNWVMRHKVDIAVVSGGLVALAYLSFSDIACPSYMKVGDAEKVLGAVSTKMEQADHVGKVLTPKQAYNGLNLEEVLNK